MATFRIATIYDELLEYLAHEAPPEKILAFKVSQEAQQRADYLIDRSSAGQLTPEETLEVEQILHFERRISILKARAAAAVKLQ